MKKFVYFRTATQASEEVVTVTTAYGNSKKVGYACYPAENFVNAFPMTDNRLAVQFLPIKSGKPVDGDSQGRLDEVQFAVPDGKQKEAMESILAAVYGSNTSNGFQVIADETTGELAPHINQCTNIHAEEEKRGYGFHEYSEVVTPGAVDDNDVAASLTIELPAQCQIIDAGMTVLELASNNVGSVALEMHNAHISADAASAGTEIVGADVAGDASSPDADLDISSDATVGDTVTMGSLARIDRGTSVTRFNVTAKEDMKSTAMTGEPQVLVSIKWFGPSADLIQVSS